MNFIKRFIRKTSYYATVVANTKFLKSTKIRRQPVAISVEASSNCNLKCKYCYYSEWNEKVQRQRGNMSVSLFRQMVESIDSEQVPINIDFDSGGDPFSNPCLMDMIDLACANEDRFVSVTTNGTLIDDHLIDRILGSGLKKINFSIDVVNGENIRYGSSLNKVVSNLEKLVHKRNKSKRKNPQVVVRSVGLPNVSKGKVDCIFEEKPDSIFLNPPINWAGLLDYPVLGKSYSVCLLPWLKLNMLFDGRFSICCNDPRGSCIVGRFPEESIKEIWHGERLFEVRNRILNKNMSFLQGQNCGSCSRLKNPITLQQKYRYLLQEIKDCFR